MSNKTIVGLALVTAVAWATEVDLCRAAGDAMDTHRGEELARAWCSECHQVERNRLAEPILDIPSFTALARAPATTEVALRAFLRSPHPSMPNIKLTPTDTDEIVAYILSLR